MKTSPDEDSCLEADRNSQGLRLPTQHCRRRSLPRLPGLHLDTASMNFNTESNQKGSIIAASPNGGLSTRISSTNTSTHNLERRGSHLGIIISNHNESDLSWSSPTQHHQATNQPWRPNLQLQLESPEFADQFDAYLYQSKHIATPMQAPEVMLELPSEESSRRPSKCSEINGSMAMSPCFPYNELPLTSYVLLHLKGCSTDVLPMQATSARLAGTNMCLQFPLNHLS